jgi:hypothetical protein
VKQYLRNQRKVNRKRKARGVSVEDNEDENDMDKHINQDNGDSELSDIDSMSVDGVQE